MKIALLFLECKHTSLKELQAMFLTMVLGKKKVFFSHCLKIQGRETGKSHPKPFTMRNRCELLCSADVLFKGFLNLYYFQIHISQVYSEHRKL